MGDPYLDAGVRGFIVRTAKENVWRLRGYDVRDLIQEGYLCFVLVRRRYVGKTIEKREGRCYRRLPEFNPGPGHRRHFMRLLQTTFKNRIHSLARKNDGIEEVLVNDLRFSTGPSGQSAHLINEEYDRVWDRIIPPQEEEMSVLALLRGAPAEIKQLLALMVDDVVRPMRRSRRRGGLRETTNQYYARLLGLPRGQDLSGWVESYFLK